MRRVPGIGRPAHPAGVRRAPPLRRRRPDARPSRSAYTQRDVAGNLLVALSGSPRRSRPTGSIPKNGVSTPSRSRRRSTEIESFADLDAHPGHGPGAGRPPQILGNLASITRGARARDRVALQRPARHRHLRRRRRDRPRLRGRPDRAARRGVAEGAPPRVADHHARADPDDARLVPRVCSSGSCSRSSSSTC